MEDFNFKKENETTEALNEEYAITSGKIAKLTEDLRYEEDPEIRRKKEAELEEAQKALRGFDKVASTVNEGIDTFSDGVDDNGDNGDNNMKKAA